MNLRKAWPYSILVTGGLIVCVEAPVSLADTQTAQIPSSVNEGEIPIPEGCRVSLYKTDRLKQDSPSVLSVEFPVLVPSDGSLASNVQAWLGLIPFEPSWKVFVYAENTRSGRLCEYLIPDEKPWTSAGAAYDEFLVQYASYIKLNGITCVELLNSPPVQSP